MGISNAGCCCCGIAVGFLAAALATGAVVYYLRCRANPDVPRRDIETVETTWEKVKTGGDKLIERAKKETHGTPIPPPENNSESFEIKYESE